MTVSARSGMVFSSRARAAVVVPGRAARSRRRGSSSPRPGRCASSHAVQGLLHAQGHVVSLRFDRATVRTHQAPRALEGRQISANGHRGDRKALASSSTSRSPARPTNAEPCGDASRQHSAMWRHGARGLRHAPNAPTTPTAMVSFRKGHRNSRACRRIHAWRKCRSFWPVPVLEPVPEKQTAEGAREAKRYPVRLGCSSRSVFVLFDYLRLSSFPYREEKSHVNWRLRGETPAVDDWLNQLKRSAEMGSSFRRPRVIA